MAKASEKRSAVIRRYGEILGRNKYSQARRDYCYRKHSDGNYYSDCSSSVSYAYREAGHGFGILNTVGMYRSELFEDVPVVIKNGVIQNPELLRPGDMLLFAGSDNSRSYADCVGHVEMVAKTGNKVTIYGHGSGTPRATEMNAYCKSRFSKKTGTVIGNRGLLKVRRFIPDDAEDRLGKIRVTAAVSAFVRTGPGTAYPAMAVVLRGREFECSDTAQNGWKCISVGGKTGWISPKMCAEV